jgi:hypothetical protein
MIEILFLGALLSYVLFVDSLINYIEKDDEDVL